MKYTLKLLWHGAILLGRVGWILMGAALTFVCNSAGRVHSTQENEDSWEQPDPGDTSHPNWHLYYKDESIN